MLAYKYRSNIDIRQDTFSLLKHEIYAPTLEQLNDPFEKTIIHFLKKQSKESSQLGEVSKLLEIIEKNIGIYSLSLKDMAVGFPNNELMWSHYANAHKGFCIEYDTAMLMDNYLIPKVVHQTPVLYDLIDIPKIATLKGMDMINSLLSIKSTAWSYENESRLIFDAFGRKEYNPAALKAVYFGMRMKQEERELIIKGLEGVKVDFYEIRSVEGEFKLVSEKIQSNDIYIKDRLPKTTYEILSSEILPKVHNFMVLYKDCDKSSNAIEYFISKFRQEHAIKASNITVVDDKRVQDLLNKKDLAPSERSFLSQHWLSYSTFDAPDVVWMYPER